MKLVSKIRRLICRVQRSGNADEKLKLHLGCGFDYWRGYVNIDISDNSVCDLRIDFSKINEIYPCNSISEVAMIHSLSYLRLWQARDLFRDLHRLLTKGGSLIIELPDVIKCSKLATEAGGDIDKYLEGVRGIYAFGMDQIKGKDMYTPYAFGWTGWHLKHELEKAGFNKVIIAQPQTHTKYSEWRDTRVEAYK